MLDVAAGTGDIALRVAQHLGPTHGRSCVVSDLCPAMLDVAKRRAGPSGRHAVQGVRRASPD
jgi:ubiquinone/menaquinone biosynthesis C-methylase UbiE